MEVVHSIYISSFLEKMAKLACHKRVIFIGATSEGLITLKGVFVISSYFYCTLRAMFNSSLGGDSFFQKSNFCIFLPILVSCLVVICMCFSFLFLFVLCHI